MKKIICVIMTIALLMVGMCACGSNSTEEADNVGVDNTSTAEQKTGEAKTIDVGETVTVESKYGSFEVKVVSAAKTDWYDEDDSSYAATVRFEINNIDYVGEYDEGYLNGYTLSDVGVLTAEDEEGFTKTFYDIAGPTDGEYGVEEDINTGQKAKASFPYIVGNDITKLIININNQYLVPIDIDQENVVTY